MGEGDLITHHPADGQAEEFWQVQCLDHTQRHACLDRAVSSAAHAANLEAKHLRDHHGRASTATDAIRAIRRAFPAQPAGAKLLDLDLHLTGPATLAAMAYSLPAGNELAAGLIAMWEALWECDREQGEELVRLVQAERAPVTAAVVPL